MMMELGCDSRGIFIQINSAIREGSFELLQEAIAEVRRVGWNHSALSSPVLTRILGMRNKIFQEEVTKSRVLVVADAVSEVGSVNNPAEVCTVLYLFSHQCT